MCLTWIDNPLGKYYLYFAHHKGDYIRLAYVDSITGPWHVYDAGSLQLADSGFATELQPVSDANAALVDLWNTFSIYVFRDFLLFSYRAMVVDAAVREQRGIPAAQSYQPDIASPEVVVDEDNQRLVMY